MALTQPLPEGEEKILQLRTGRRALSVQAGHRLRFRLGTWFTPLV
jgi:hypothetical protein